MFERPFQIAINCPIYTGFSGMPGNSKGQFSASSNLYRIKQFNAPSRFPNFNKKIKPYWKSPVSFGSSVQVRSPD
jgi:hypothetical protein